MKKTVWLVVLSLFLAAAARAEFSFFLIDNFEGGKTDKWYRFGNLDMSAVKVPSLEAGVQDTIADSCGDYALKLKGKTTNWYIGGIGTELMTDAKQFSRFQMDVNGYPSGGKIKIELFGSGGATKCVAEVPILGQGYTRISIPFSAFKPETPSAGADGWRPGKSDGSSYLQNVQLILLAAQATGEAEADIDNILLTY